MEPQLYIDAVLKLRQAEDFYRDINKKIRGYSREDFTSYVRPIDPLLKKVIVRALDDALLEMTGFSLMASYHLYEGKNKYIRDEAGVEYRWSDDKGFERVIFEMIKNNGIAEAKKRDLEYRKNIAKLIRHTPKYEA